MLALADRYWTCVGHVLGMFWACYGNVCGYVMGMCQASAGHVLGMSWVCLGHSMGLSHEHLLYLCNRDVMAMSDNVLAMLWKCFVNALFMYWACSGCSGNVLVVICWRCSRPVLACPGSVLKIFCVLWRHSVFAMLQQCYGNVIGIFWSCSGQVLGMCW